MALRSIDLMIGDWVKKGNLLGKVVDIEQRDNIAVVGVEFNEGGYDVYNDDELKPIHLTPEILEKNELTPDTVEDAYKYCYKKDDVSIVECYANAGGRYRGIFHFGETRLRITLMFVHELQHALRLCEIEHEITL